MYICRLKIRLKIHGIIITVLELYSQEKQGGGGHFVTEFFRGLNMGLL